MLEDDGFVTVHCTGLIMCEACNGQGEVPRYRLQHTLDPDTIRCCVCKGEGMVKASQCPTCGYDLESQHPGFLHSCPECTPQP